MQGSVQARPITRTARMLPAVLIAFSAVLFVIGLAVERSGCESSEQHKDITSNASTVLPSFIRPKPHPRQVSESTIVGLGLCGEA